MLNLVQASDQSERDNKNTMMDYFFLHAIINQLKGPLQGAVLNKVFQPQEHILILRFWNGGAQQRLLIDLSGDKLGLYISDQAYRNPVRPPRFCQLLRARLQRLVDLQLDQADRVVRMTFVGTDAEMYLLVVELFGRVGNVFLLDAKNCIIDSLLRSRGTGQRVQVNAQPYVAAPVSGDIALDDVLAVVNTEDLSAQWLLKHVSPIHRWIDQGPVGGGRPFQ